MPIEDPFSKAELHRGQEEAQSLAGFCLARVLGGAAGAEFSGSRCPLGPCALAVTMVNSGPAPSNDVHADGAVVEHTKDLDGASAADAAWTVKVPMETWQHVVVACDIADLRNISLAAPQLATVVWPEFLKMPVNLAGLEQKLEYHPQEARVERLLEAQPQSLQMPGDRDACRLQLCLAHCRTTWPNHAISLAQAVQLIVDVTFPICIFARIS